MPRVTVVVPNYNHSRYLELRLSTIFNQSYQDFDVIVLDDKSTDNSVEIIDSYRNHPKVKKIILNEKNGNSVFKQWQKGVELVESEFVWIAESDDYSSLNFLEKVISLMDANPTVGLAFVNSYWVDEKGEAGDSLSLYENSFKRSGGMETIAMMEYNTIQNVSSCLFRTSLAKKSLRGIERFPSCGDWRFYLNMLSGCDVIYDSERLNYFRWYHNNVSNAAYLKGSWLTEGAEIISQIQPKNVAITAGHYRAILFNWVERVKRSRNISFLDKINAYKHLSIALLKLTVNKGI